MRIFEPIISGSTISNSNIRAISFTGSISGSIYLPDGQLLVGNTSNNSVPRTISGDVTFNNTGVTAIGTGKVLTTMLDPNIIWNTTTHETSQLDLTYTNFFVTSGSNNLNRSLNYTTFLNDLRPRLNTGSFTGSFTGSIRQTLPSANIFVGNASNIAAAVAMSGDVIIDNTGVTSLNGRVVDETELNNDIISQFNTWSTLPIGGSSLFAVSDGSNRKLTYNQLTSSLSSSFSSAGLLGGSLPSLADGKIWIGNGSNVATAVTPSNDINVSNTGTFVLNSPAITGKTEVTTLEDNDYFLVYDTSATGLRKVSKLNLVPTSISASGGYIHNFTNTIFIPVTHSLNTATPIVQVYNEVSELFIPQNIKISGSNHVQITLSNTGSGYVVIQKPGSIAQTILGSSSYSTTFSGQSSITVNHNLDSQYPFVQVYNTAGYMIVPGDVRVINSSSLEVIFPVNTLSGSITVAKAGHVVSGSTITNAVSASYADYIQSPAVRTHTIPFGISSPVVITAGAKGLKTIGREGKIIGWRLVSDVSTTATLDIWKTNSAIPTNGNSICASAKPSLTAGTFNSSTTLTGWTDTFTSNDVFRVEVESNNNAMYLLLELDFLVDND